jgi:hypothetical protein
MVMTETENAAQASVVIRDTSGAIKLKEVWLVAYSEILKRKLKHFSGLGD